MTETFQPPGAVQLRGSHPVATQGATLLRLLFELHRLPNLLTCNGNLDMPAEGLLAARTEQERHRNRWLVFHLHDLLRQLGEKEDHVPVDAAPIAAPPSAAAWDEWGSAYPHR